MRGREKGNDVCPYPFPGGLIGARRRTHKVKENDKDAALIKEKNSREFLKKTKKLVANTKKNWWRTPKVLLGKKGPEFGQDASVRVFVF